MLVFVLLAALVGAALAAAAALKIADRTGTAIAAETFGLRGPTARWVWLPLAALEASLATAFVAEPTGAPAWLAAGLLAAFAVAQAGAIAAGRSGAPCGCFGARGHLSWGSVARAVLLAAAAVSLARAPGADAPPSLATGLLALILAAAIVVRARRPAGALEIAGEGPALGARLDAGGAPLALFVSDGCRLCRALAPQARRLGGAVYDEVADAAMWSAANVPGAPFVVALAADGTVLAKGTVNTRAQLASVVAAADGRRGQIGHPEPDGPENERQSSRRSFLQTASAAVAAITAGRLAGSLVTPGDADAFHFCGHIFTTDGCPHPTGLPRIDRNGFALRAKDGLPVDDLGRLVDAAGAPLDDAGAPLLDPDGRPQPPATRTRVCAAAGKRYRINVRTDGAWYRCCNGHVRKLQDCCTTSSRRVNGDRGLRGYCYGRRKVFCVMYLQTRVPC
nr:MauE/DoxX family redox-associated membrane protein [Solirubrobacteraceae bacterium]